MTAGWLAVSAAVAPFAIADPVTQVHDFETGDGAWFSYANTGSITSGVVAGEYCADVSGGTNPWDVAVQHDAVTYDRATTYTVSFDAHASIATSIPMQGGAGYPAAFGHTFALDGTATPQHVEFTFAPADWPTGAGSPLASDWTTTTGNTSFQLGAKASPYTFCFDNFSITPVAPELIPNGDFASGTLTPWFAAGSFTTDLSSGALVVGVPAASGIYDGVGFNGVAIEAGTTYTLSFTATASAARSVRVLVGQNGAPWGTVLDQMTALSDVPTPYSYTFTANASYPAATNPTDGPEGQLAFQVGGRGADWTLTLDDVSLKESVTPPAPYSPDTGSRVRVNQVGYLPDGPKHATLVTDAVDPVAWELLDGVDVVASGMSVPLGVDWSSGLNVQEIDFSSFAAEGMYALSADADVSTAFAIDANLYQQLRYDALNYFYPVRSGIAIDGAIAGAAYARDAGHLNDPAQSLDATANKGDVAVPCLTAAEDGASWAYGDWTCPDGYALDVVGGWYDAGDHGKYVVNGGISVAQVMSTYERSLYAPTGTPGALADGSLNVPESANGVPDALDEAAWELEWMLSMQVPAEYPQYAGMVHHKIHDVGWTGIPLLPSNDPQERRLHRPSTAATLNLAAAAAQGARLFADYEDEYPGFAEQLLDAARVAWDAAVATPDLYAPAAAGNNGGGPYDDTDMTDEFYWAASELYITTGEDTFRDAVLTNPENSADVFGGKSFDWADTAAFARTELAMVPNGLPGRAAIQASVVAGADKYLAWQAGEAFGSTYPGKDAARTTYEWGSNSMVVNNANVLAVAFDLTGDDSYRTGAIEALDYLLGRNALNYSYVTDWGVTTADGPRFAHNQHSRWFAHQAEPSLPNPPSGSLSGGPNSTQSTWDPTMQGLFGGGNDCTPSMCYTDYYNSWASNEITINWNSALSYLASFVADQGAGAVDAGAMVTITEQPADVAVGPGGSVTFTAAATGDPAPTVQWQRQLGNDAWTDIPSADAATLTFAAEPSMHGALYRAVFTNTFGWIATDPAQLTVTSMVSIPPVRVLTAAAVSPGAVQCFQVAGAHGVPASATGVVVNVTTVRPTGVGYVVVYPDTLGTGATPRPGTSTVNFEPGQDVANTTWVGLPDDGALCYSSVGAASVGILMDVSGYTTQGSGIVLAAPQRLVDTRAASRVGPIAGPVEGRRTVTTIQVAGVAGVPVGAEAVVLNATVTGVSTVGNLRLFPAGNPVPNASVVNYVPGRDKANAAVVALSDDGKISLYSDTYGGAEVILDVLGYVAADADYTGMVPTRVVDTRPGAGHIGALGELEARTVYSVPMAGDDVPAGATAVVLNVTAIGPTTIGNLRVYPDSAGTGLTAPPNASSLNYVVGRDVPNLVVVQLPANGQVNFYSDQPLGGRVHLAVDVVGYLGIIAPPA